jgi:hypothetical protein
VYSAGTGGDDGEVGSVGGGIGARWWHGRGGIGGGMGCYGGIEQDGSDAGTKTFWICVVCVTRRGVV